MAGIVDLRSDTFTLPTSKMREAMAKAPVGDDVFEEDPTVNRLEALAADIVGKEAALFVVSGTMGNLIATLTHTKPGDEVVLGAHSHIYGYEVGGISRIGGLIPRLVDDSQGIISPEAVLGALRGENIHYAPTALVCMENSHNMSGGRVTDVEQTKALAAACREHGLKIHMDGARVFNAAAALDVPVKRLTQLVDSVMFCLSKGLSAPVGSMLAGDREFIGRARKFRKILGGGMRQAGVIAAAGVVALEEMVERLGEDHARAKRLVDGLANIPGLKVVASEYQTNIVLVDVEGTGLSSDEFVEALALKGIKVLTRNATVLRAVIHRHVEDGDIDKALEGFSQVATK
ncbi:MAG: aminotransferase class I/II-fold pyridoxal phosphate-dependent enzyme [Firmicutes bacterium]|nr:aminotransferase class I/II-fold pyridoxal phosphate-dependent enzyme [Bacillota bacterium]